MKHYDSIVPDQLGIELKKAGYPQNLGNSWYNQDKSLDSLPFSDPLCAAPTYAEVFDWLLESKETAVNISGIFLGPHYVWDWEVYTPKFHEWNECYETFEICACDAVEMALKLLKRKK